MPQLSPQADMSLSPSCSVFPVEDGRPKSSPGTLCTGQSPGTAAHCWGGEEPRDGAAPQGTLQVLPLPPTPAPQPFTTPWRRPLEGPCDRQLPPGRTKRARLLICKEKGVVFTSLGAHCVPGTAPSSQSTKNFTLRTSQDHACRAVTRREGSFPWTYG